MHHERRVLKAAAVAIALATILPPCFSRARCLEEVARLPAGTSLAVAPSGSLVLFGGGLHLITARDLGVAGLDVLGTTRLPGLVRDIAVVGNLAFVACDRRGLAVVDVSQPRRPAQLGFLATGDAFHLAVSGELVLVAAGPEGLIAVDVSEPGRPHPLWIHATGSIAWDVVVHRDQAYVTTDNGVIALDVAGPGAPSQRSRFLEDRLPGALAVAGRHLFVTGFDRGLDVVDISDPDAPVVVGSADASESSGWHIEVDHGLAAVANGSLYLLDVSEPTSPRFLSAFATPGAAMAGVLNDRTVLVADGSAGVTVVDVADPSRPWVVGRSMLWTTPNLVALTGDLAVTAAPDELQVVDLSKPSAPVVRGTIASMDRIQDVALDGSLAFVAELGVGLRIVDLEDADHPVHVGEIPLTAATAVAAAGRLSVVTDFETLVVVDVADPSRPDPVGEVDLGAIGWDVEIAGDTAFVACREAGVMAVELADLGSPQLAGVFPAANVGGRPAQAIAVAGSFAYVAFRGAGLRVLDVSDPANIREVGQQQLPDIYATDVSVDGSMAFVADPHHDVLWVLDVTDPEEVRVLDLVGVPGRVAADSGIVTVAAWAEGLPVYDTEHCRFGEPAAPLAWQPAEPIAGQPVRFTPLDLDADSWEWVFGDGTVTTGMIPTREFRSEGAETVLLTVTRDGAIESHAATFEVAVAAPRRPGGRSDPRSAPAPATCKRP